MWIPAFAGTTVGGVGVTDGGTSLTPILTFPRQGGRDFSPSPGGEGSLVWVDLLALA